MKFTLSVRSSLLSKIAFGFTIINDDVNEPVTMTLYAGEGFGGPVLATVTQTLPLDLPSDDSPPQFVDFDFTGVQLIVGQMYTAAVSLPIIHPGSGYGSFRIGVGFCDFFPEDGDIDPYPYGTSWDGIFGQNLEQDLYFRVTPVPEPSSLALLALGGLAIVSWRRRRAA